MGYKRSGVQKWGSSGVGYSCSGTFTSTGWDTNGVGYRSGALPELDTRVVGHLQVQSGIHKLRCSRSGTLNEIHTEWDTH